LSAVIDPDASRLASAISLLTTTRDRGGLELGMAHPDGGVGLSHTGGTGGFRSFVSCIPQWGRGVAVICNSAVDAVADLGAHLQDTRTGMLWYRKEVAINQSALAGLVGRYRMNPKYVFEITISENRLYAQLTGQRAYRLFPASKWHFFYKVAGAQITFERGKDGRAARLILHQNSRDQIAERIG
jgi:serine-type D-Ala-D-Ala carboxypeptidase/endopeptidase